MWAEVLAILKANENIGQTLLLRCPRRPEAAIEVSTPDDFLRLAPYGGYNKKCSLRLSCGHSCINKYHSEPLHNAVICLQPCPRSKAGCDIHVHGYAAKNTNRCATSKCPILPSCAAIYAHAWNVTRRGISK